MIKAFLAALAGLLAAAGFAVALATIADPTDAGPEGTSSTPGAFALLQLGSASFGCDSNWAVQPRQDMHSAVATEKVTIRAGAIVRRNITRKVVGPVHGRPLIEQQYSSAQELALPFGRYRTVTFSLRQADEARVIDATLTADFVAGTFAVRAVARGLVA